MVGDGGGDEECESPLLPTESTEAECVARCVRARMAAELRHLKAKEKGELGAVMMRSPMLLAVTD